MSPYRTPAPMRQSLLAVPHRNARMEALCVLAFRAAATVAVINLSNACAFFTSRPAEAEASYFGKQLECADRGKSREEIDACRKAVRVEWGVAETVTDAGADR